MLQSLHMHCFVLFYTTLYLSHFAYFLLSGGAAPNNSFRDAKYCEHYESLEVVGQTRQTSQIKELPELATLRCRINDPKYTADSWLL